MPYQVTKTYGHDKGWSCTYRQWRAQSHCRFDHGYALSFQLCFQSDDLDHLNWVLDFGGLKSVESWLKENFDHRKYVASDDPQMSWYVDGALRGTIDEVVIVPRISCECFAKMVFDHVKEMMPDLTNRPEVKLVYVKVDEHPGNGATYYNWNWVKI